MPVGHKHRKVNFWNVHAPFQERMMFYGFDLEKYRSSVACDRQRVGRPGYNSCWRICIFRRVRKIAKSECWPHRPSARMEQLTRLPLDGFSWNLIFEPVLLKSYNNNGYFTRRPTRILWQYFIKFFLAWEMFRMRNVSDKSCRVNQGTVYVK
jgi:hypothetical protein